ncbi:putative histidine kinase 5 [Wolffia australiana]
MVCWVWGRMSWSWRVRNSGFGCGGGGVKEAVLWVLVIFAGLVGFSCGQAFCGFLMSRMFSYELLRKNALALGIGRSYSRSLASAFFVFEQDCNRVLEKKESLRCKWENYETVAKLLLKFFGSAIVAGLLNRKASSFLATLHGIYSTFFKLHYSKKKRSSRCRILRKKLLFIGVVAGVIISLWTYFIMSANITARHKENLSIMCDERARMLQDQFNVSMNHVHALAILVSTFHHGKLPSAIDQRTFAEYTARTAFERPLTSGVACALRVVHSQREMFEKEQGWTIKKMETGGQSTVRDRLEPAPVQDEYAPVIFSQETVSHIISIDMMSGKEDRDNIIRARSTGKGVLTSPFKLLKSNHLGVVLTFAVYNRDLNADATTEDRVKATVGYLGASFDMPSLVEKLLQQLASKQNIVVNVYDTTNASCPLRMYGPDVPNPGLLHVSHVDFGDPMRKHEMHCRFKQNLPPPWSVMTTSTGILVIILLLGHIFNAAINRIEKVEDDYHEMRELKGRAEAADVAKSQFLATVSHEIRTPMNGVLGMLQMLMDTDLDATQQDYAMTAQDSGKALIALINEVLDQAKIESGRLELEAVPFDVRALLDSILSLFFDKSLEKGIEVAVYVSDLVPEVLVGDPGRFRQIITNLLGNSIKFTDGGHVFVSLHLTMEAKSDTAGDGDPAMSLSGFRVVDRRRIWDTLKTVVDGPETVNVLVTVEDTGVGIPPEAQARIFMPFMQADSSMSRTYGGTGIGLSISKCLVRRMGGNIAFGSEPGIGTTFSFTASFRPGCPCRPGIPEFSGMTALVLDPCPVRAEVTRYHLCRLGIGCHIVPSPATLLALLSRSNVDMVLADEEACGSDLLAELRRQHGRRVKVFLVAAPRRHCQHDDVDGVVTKPLRPSTITACIRGAPGTKIERSPPLPLKSILSGRRILVVDDNAVNRKVAAGALTKLGAHVTCADSGKAAVEMLRPPHPFHACFMDVQMPEMDGFEATTQVRSTERIVNEEIAAADYEWHVPILAMTADVIQATQAECERAGMDGYVSKPIEEEQLYAAVTRFFDVPLPLSKPL